MDSNHNGSPTSSLDSRSSASSLLIIWHHPPPQTDSRFTQQELPACKPILTPKWVITAFMLIAIVLINIRVATLFASRYVVEIVDRYETDCIPASSGSVKVIYIQASGNKTCNKTLMESMVNIDLQMT
ncbi:hypothetical protein ABKV19_014542 [Rosa sericea]